MQGKKLRIFSHAMSLTLLLITLVTSPLAQAESRETVQPSLSDLTIVVSSCDKYSELWDGFFTLLFRQMPSLKTTNAHVPIVLVSNKKEYLDPRVKTIHTNPKEGWSDNMLEALKQVKTPYILYLQDDYFLTKFDEKRFKEIYAEMLSAKVISYIQVGAPDEKLITGGPYEKLPGVRYRGKHDHFRSNLQAAIWKTEDLEFLIRPGENPWLFEDRSNTRSQGFRTPFLAVVKDVPLAYLNMAAQGYLMSGNVRTAKKLGIEMQRGQLPLDTEMKPEEKKWWKFNFTRFMKKVKVCYANI